MYSIIRFPTANIARTASRTVARALALVCALGFASGCSLLSENLDRAAKGVGKVVTYYCENVTVPEIREEVRAAVNKHSAPHSVAVTCADGGPTLNSSEAGPTTLNWRELFERLRMPIFYPEHAANA
jgi:hypothetical protein